MGGGLISFVLPSAPSNVSQAFWCFSVSLFFSTCTSKLQTQRNVGSLKAVSLHKALTTHELILQQIQGPLCPNKSMPILLQCCDLLDLLWCVVCVCVCVFGVGGGMGRAFPAICRLTHVWEFAHVGSELVFSYSDRCVS